MQISNIPTSPEGFAGRGKYIISTLLAVIGLSLFFVTTDREFINLSPTEGELHGISLETGTIYEQSFPATRSSVSRIGLFLRPVTRDIPAAALIVGLLQNGEKVGEQALPAAFIDTERSSQVRFSPRVPVKHGDNITIRLTVPPELSGKIRIQQREPDETFDNTYATSTINGEVQPGPFAYQVYYGYKPPLAIQLGGLALLCAVYLLLTRWIKQHQIVSFIVLAAILAILYTVPASLLTSYFLYLISVIFLAFLAMFFFLQRQNLSFPSALTGASIFAFTTWWPLHFATDWHWPAGLARQAPLLKDIFLDPRQIPTANGGNWEHFGSYIGIIGFALATIGFLSVIGKIQRQSLSDTSKKIPITHSTFHITVIVILLLALPLIKIGVPDISILITFSLAIFAARGLETLKNFISRADQLTNTIIYIIAALVLLDLFHISARTLEFGLI